MFDLLVNGCGDAFSTRHWGTSFLLRRGDFVLAIDTPDSYLRALEDNAFEHGDGTLQPGDVDGLFLTHLHGDHVNGLEMFLAHRVMVLQKEPLDIWTSPQVAEALWERRLAASLGRMWNGTSHETMRLRDFARLHVVDWGAPKEIGPFTFRTRRTVHHIPTSALRITDGDATLSYSCDTAFSEELFAWLETDSDLIVHETSYGAAHTPLHRLLSLSEEVRERLLVVHYPDDLIGVEADVKFARQGAAYGVGSPD